MEPTFEASEVLELRKILKWSQLQLAEALGLRQACQVHRREKGDNRTRGPVAVALSSIMSEHGIRREQLSPSGQAKTQHKYTKQAQTGQKSSSRQTELRGSPLVDIL